MSNLTLSLKSHVTRVTPQHVSLINHGGDNHRSAGTKIDITWILALIIVVTCKVQFGCVLC